MKSSTLSPPKTIVISLMSNDVRVLITLCIIGLLKTGGRCLLVTFVNGDNLVPVPPAKIIPLMIFRWTFLVRY